MLASEPPGHSRAPSCSTKEVFQPGPPPLHEDGAEVDVARAHRRDLPGAAGLAKGTVYLYFRTKEAIFADVLLEGWGGVLRDLESAFAGDAERDAQVATFLARLVAYLDAHPELLRLDGLRLDGLGPGVVERNLDPETRHAFKRALAGRLTDAGTVMERALGLAPGRGLQVLMRTYALTRGLWQSIGAPDAGAPAGRGRALFSAGFRDELAEALAEYWRGALAPVDLRG